MGMPGQSLAVAAGLCAATASSCAKLAMAGESTLLLCHNLVGNVGTYPGLDTPPDADADAIGACDTVVVYARVAFFALVFVFNALMWTLFVKSLQLCTSSIQATVTNSAANFFFTAVQGWLIFGEVLNLLWWFGASMVVVGLVLIHRGSSSQTAGQGVGVGVGDKQKVS